MIGVVSDSVGVGNLRMWVVKFSSSEKRNLHLSLRGAAWVERVEKRGGGGDGIGRITSSYAANVGQDGGWMGWIRSIRVRFIGRITRNKNR